MGAVTYLPYAHAKSDVAVPIWNGAHAIVDHTTGANVTCELQRANGLWYKLATRADLHADEPGRELVPMTGRYISAALTDLLSVPAGYAWGPCPGNTDQPGRWYPDRAVLAAAAAAALAAILAARLILKRRRPRPEPPPVL
jgi:hypothetical protein